jgi:transcriptional adapter 2-alpha
MSCCTLYFFFQRNNFPLFAESSWTASEERMLVDAIAECGIGNWQDVSNQLQTRSKYDCEQHYYRFYFDNPQPPLPGKSSLYDVGSNAF